MSAIFPILGLRIQSQRLLLRPRAGDDPILQKLYTSISGKLLEPGEDDWMNGEWYKADPETLYREAAKNTMRKMLDWSADDWTLQLFVHREEQAIGEISLRGRDFLQRRSISTGSWLHPDYRRQGYGREMRGAVLFFGFRILGAKEFRSKAHSKNLPSSKTSLSLGYKQDGTETYMYPGDRERFCLSHEDWLDDVPTEVEGFKECRNSFGLSS